jgi:hypothetical protein
VAGRHYRSTGSCYARARLVARDNQRRYSCSDKGNCDGPVVWVRQMESDGISTAQGQSPGDGGAHTGVFRAAFYEYTRMVMIGKLTVGTGVTGPEPVARGGVRRDPGPKNES